MKKLLILILVFAFVSAGSGLTYLSSSINANGTMSVTNSLNLASGSEIITLTNTSPIGSSTFNMGVTASGSSVTKTENASLYTNKPFWSGYSVSKSELVTYGSPSQPVSLTVNKTTTALIIPPIPPVAVTQGLSGNFYGYGSANITAWSKKYITETGTVSWTP